MFHHQSDKIKFPAHRKKKEKSICLGFSHTEPCFNQKPILHKGENVTNAGVFVTRKQNARISLIDVDRLGEHGLLIFSFDK